MENKRHFIYAVSTLLGYVIGAGLFGLPYVMQKMGFIPAVFLLTILMVTMYLNCLSLAEVILRTRGNHYFPGLVGIYLGRRGKWLQFWSNTIVGNYGALLAYIVLGGVFLKDIFKPFLSFFGDFPILLGGELSLEGLLVGLFVFFGIGLIWKGFENLGIIEIILSMALVAIILIIALVSFNKIDYHNYFTFDSRNALPAVGVILFALDGTGGVFILRNILKRREWMIRKSIIWVYSIVTAVFFIFPFSIVGVFGSDVSKEAVTMVASHLGPGIEFIAVVFGFLAVFSSFLVTGSVFKNTLYYDFKMSKLVSWLLVWTVPLVLYLIGFNNFIAIISLVGVIVGCINTLLIALLLRRARKKGNRKPELTVKMPLWVQYVIIAFYFVATYYEVSCFEL